MPTQTITRIFPDSCQDSFTAQSKFDKTYSTLKSGVSVPGYKQKIKEKLNASSPYSSDYADVLTAEPFNITHTYGKLGYGSPFPYVRKHYGYRGPGHGGLPPHAGTVSASQENKALSEVYKRIREEHSAMNGLLAAAEFRQTLALLGNPARLGAKLVTNYLSELKSTRSLVRSQVRPRRSDTPGSLIQRRLNSTKDRMSGSWLALQFGILPTISDARDILQEVANSSVNAMAARPARISGSSGEAVIVGTVGNPEFTFPPYTPMLFSAYETFKSVHSVRYKVGLNNSVKGPWNQINSLSERLGFTVENFVPTLYELIPWSFLLDYFVNLGDIVEAATTCTSNVYYITRTVRSETIYRYNERWIQRSEPWVFGNWVTYSMTGNPASLRVVRRRTITRTCPTSLPLPALELSVPPLFKKDDTVNKQWFNMGALLAQARDFKF